VAEVSKGDSLDMSIEEIMSFLEEMKLIINDGSRIKSVVKFIGVKFSRDTHQRCRVLNNNGTTHLVDQEMVHFLENLDIASIPQTSDDYCRECETVSIDNLKDILKL